LHADTGQQCLYIHASTHIYTHAVSIHTCIHTYIYMHTYVGMMGDEEWGSRLHAITGYQSLNIHEYKKGVYIPYASLEFE